MLGVLSFARMRMLTGFPAVNGDPSGVVTSIAPIDSVREPSGQVLKCNEADEHPSLMSWQTGILRTESYTAPSSRGASCLTVTVAPAMVNVPDREEAGKTNQTDSPDCPRPKT